jgi:hypothetical protein
MLGGRKARARRGGCDEDDDDDSFFCSLDLLCFFVSTHTFAIYVYVCSMDNSSATVARHQLSSFA